MKNAIIAIAITLTIAACDNAGYATAPIETPDECSEYVDECNESISQAKHAVELFRADEEACEASLVECESVIIPKPVDCSSALKFLEKEQAKVKTLTDANQALKVLMPLAATDLRFREMCDNGEINGQICLAMLGE